MATVLLGLGVISFIVIVAILASKLPRINALSVFTAIWLPLTAVCLIPGVIEPGMQPRTLAMIGLAFSGAVAGFVVGSAIPPTRARTVVPGLASVRVDADKLGKWHRLLVGVLLGYAALHLLRSLPLVQSLGGWTAIFSTSGGDFRRAQLESGVAAAQAAFESGGAALGVLNYVLFLGHGSIFTGTFLWLRGRRLAGITPVLVCALYGLLSLQRASLAMAGLLFFFGLAALRGKLTQVPRVASSSDPTSNQRRPPRVFILSASAAACAFALFYPLAVRNRGTSNAIGLDSVAQYLVSGILGLNARNVVNPSLAPAAADIPNGELALGSYTFSNTFNVLNRLGLDIQVAPIFFDFYRVKLADSIYVTNTGTSIIDFFLDFGWPGIFLGFFLLALSASITQQYIRYGVVALVPIAAFLLASVAWSFFGNTLLNDVRYLLATIVGSVVLRSAMRNPVTSNGSPGRVEHNVKSRSDARYVNPRAADKACEGTRVKEATT